MRSLARSTGEDEETKGAVQGNFLFKVHDICVDHPCYIRCGHDTAGSESSAGFAWVDE